VTWVDCDADFFASEGMASILKTLKHRLSKLILRPPEVPESILAFSTITTMLSCIRPTMTTNDPTSISIEQHRHLNALNALATILVTNTEAVAITTKPDKDGRFEIIACVHTAQLPEDSTIIQHLRGLGHQLWNFLVTWGFATIAWLPFYPPKDVSDLTTTEDVPTIVNPSPPSNLGNMPGISQLEKYIDTEL